MAVKPIVCIKHDVYKKFDFLKDIPYEDYCVPPEDDRRCPFLAVRGPAGDGIIELRCYNPRTAPVTLMTENGDIYSGLSADEVKDFYAGKLKPSPVKTADKANVRSFFIAMFGGEEFTPAVKAEVCKRPEDCPEPKDE